MHNVSTNIKRDADTYLKYITTPNTLELYKLLFLDENISSSFNIIGSYGTGKSTFLWACERSLVQRQNLFNIDSQPVFDSEYKFIKIIGSSEPLLKLFSRELGLRGRTSYLRVLNHLDKLLSDNPKLCLIIFIDEFGIILEKIAKEFASLELYFIQELAEWVNDKNRKAKLVTTLHQNFLDYSRSQSQHFRKEWEKVKGRFKDLLFNEPVEQLIFFASNQLSQFQPEKTEDENLNAISKLTTKYGLINPIKNSRSSFLKNLYPLEWLSANILVNSLQRYGQNERSLFTFLNDETKNSLKHKAGSYFTVSKVYDYVINALYPEINSPYNQDRAQWLISFRAIERAELIFIEDYETACELIKTILLVNLFTKKGGLFNKKFLSEYFLLSTGKNVQPIINKLHTSGIIRFYPHSNKINFLEGTDIDIEQELRNIDREVTSSSNYLLELKKILSLGVIYAKAHSFKSGIRRFFEYKIIDTVSNIRHAESGIDGYINIMLDQSFHNQARNCSEKIKDNLFVCLSGDLEIEKRLTTVLKYDLIINRHNEDINAVRLLNKERDFAIQSLRKDTLHNLYHKENHWYICGERVAILSQRELLKKISEVCDKIYHKAPKFYNELINKNVLSTPLSRARKELLTRLLENATEPNLGYPEDKYPPDKIIYQSLIEKYGIHRKNEKTGTYELGSPYSGSSFTGLWDECELFLTKTVSSRTPISDLYDIFLKEPFKLKRGFIDFWIPLFLIIKSEDFGLFYKQTKFIPYISIDTLQLLQRNPDHFHLKAYDVQGLNLNLIQCYNDLVGTVTKSTIKSTYFTIYGNLFSFFKRLNTYSRHTNNLSKQAINFRHAILNSSDPETAIIKSVPEALGYPDIMRNNEYNILNSFTQEIKRVIREIQEVYDNLIDRLEIYILEAFRLTKRDFEVYKPEIQKFLSAVEIELLSKEQQILLERLNSHIEDRRSYIKSVADSLLDYPIDTIPDHDELVLRSKLNDRIESLLMLANTQKFNQKSKDSKLVGFKFYSNNGRIFDDKVILRKDTHGKNEQILKDIEIKLHGISEREKKEILIKLYLQLISNYE